MTAPPALPPACGPLSSLALRTLTGSDDDRRAMVADLPALPHPDPDADPLGDRDLQLALWLLLEPVYGDLPGVDPALEWDPAVVGFRTALLRRCEDAVRALAAPLIAEHALPDRPCSPDERAEQVIERLQAMTAPDGPPALARFLGSEATREQFVDHLAQRAVYHLRESDPQTLALPRVEGPAKAAFAALQYDEYGGGRPERLHARLYADALDSLDLPTEVLPHVGAAEAEVLASVTTMSLLTSQRRLRGAAMGHLAAFEATSALPCRLIALGARRLELPDAVAAYFDEHVEADSVHEQLVLDEICGALVRTSPHLADDVLLGAAVCLSVDARAARGFLDRWRADDAASPDEAA